MKNLRACFVSLLVATPCWVQSYSGQYTWEEYGRRIKASEQVSPLGANFAGEQGPTQP